MSDQKRSRRGTGSIFRFKGRDVWWIKYHRDGKPIRETSGSCKVKDAEKLLAKRLAEIQNNTYIDPKEQKVTVADLYGALETNYRIMARTPEIGADKATRAERRWKARLEKHFGHIRVRKLTTDDLNKYVVWAQGEGLTNATINRDMAALRRAFYLAQEARKIESVPKFPHLTEANARTGFVEEAEFQKLIANAKELWVRAMVTTAYTFGFRKGELLKLRVEQISLTDRTIRLNPGETKSGKGRVVPLDQDLFVLLQALVIGRKGNELVFTRSDGSPVIEIRKAWYALCQKANLGHFEKNSEGKPQWKGLLFHDLRRSAVRNMIRRGVSQKVAMQISGHETPSIFQRYDIIDETDLRLAVEKIAAGAKAEHANFGQQPKFGQHLGSMEPEASAAPLDIPPLKRLPD